VADRLDRARRWPRLEWRPLPAHDHRRRLRKGRRRLVDRGEYQGRHRGDRLDRLDRPEGPAGKGADNRGIVTALPSTSLVKGETLCAFKAATGVYWWLLYTEEATYPWAKIGGPPMESHLTGEPLSTSSATYQSSGAPSITAPLAMEADLVWGAQLLASQVNELNEIRIAAFKGSTEVDWMASAGSQTFDGHGGIKRQRTTLAKSEAVTSRYASVSSKSSKFYGLQIQLDPVRVG